MPTINFNAFSFLQKTLRSKGISCSNNNMHIEQGTTIAKLIDDLELDQNQVEAAFVNGKIKNLNTKLFAEDRIALVPPGTPGPYRYLLGIRDCKNQQESK